MIGQVRGTLLQVEPPQLIVDIGGIGLEIEAPNATVAALPKIGESVTLFTHLLVKEDDLSLYGFAAAAEREFFRTLLKVSGIGAKIALAMLSGASSQELLTAIQTGDVAALTRLPGIGKKTAERLIVELRDRAEKLLGELPATAVPGGAAMVAPTDGLGEAQAALLALGYKPVEVSRMLAQADPAADAEQIIRDALAGQVKS